MRGSILFILMFLLVSQTKAQLGRNAHATFYKKTNGKMIQMCFNKKYFLQLKPSAMPKLNNFQLNDNNQTYLKLVNQIGDTLIFKEGKLLASDIEKLVSTNAASGWYISMAITIYVPFLVTYTFILPEDKIYMTIFFPAALIMTNSLLAAYQRKQINVSEYELIPQNILGKEPKI